MSEGQSRSAGQRSGRRSRREISPFVARSMATAVSAVIEAEDVHSCETSCCERPAASASFFWLPAIETARRTCSRKRFIQ